MSTEDLFKRFGRSEGGNFGVVDTLGVPHPYCVGPKHVTVAADQFGGRLGREAMIAAEKQGAKCCICKGELTYAQHEQALLVECLLPLETQSGKDTELHKYLLACKDKFTSEDEYAGFAFKAPPTTESKP